MTSDCMDFDLFCGRGKSRGNDMPLPQYLSFSLNFGAVPMPDMSNMGIFLFFIFLFSPN